MGRVETGSTLERLIGVAREMVDNGRVDIGDLEAKDLADWPDSCAVDIELWNRLDFLVRQFDQSVEKAAELDVGKLREVKNGLDPLEHYDNTIVNEDEDFLDGEADDDVEDGGTGDGTGSRNGEEGS